MERYLTESDDWYEEFFVANPMTCMGRGNQYVYQTAAGLFLVVVFLYMETITNGRVIQT